MLALQAPLLARLSLALLALQCSQSGCHCSVPEPLMRQQGLVLRCWLGLALRLALLLLALVACLLGWLDGA
ncbi:MAG: hypothetical protein KA222_00840, partial [Pseudoxanthomonas sp.]|nr:hypothetical protein [Pseudoxanthomonas sp.]